MNIKKIISVMIAVALVFTHLPAYKGAAETVGNESVDETELYQAEFEQVKEEVYDELNMEYTDEIDLQLTNMDEEAINIDTTFNSDDLEVDSELEMDIESEEMNLKTAYKSEDGKEINQEFNVEVEEIDNDVFKATFTDNKTGEKYSVNSEEVEASILPAIIVGVIVRTSVKAAFKMYSRSQILKSLMNVSFNATQLQKKFKHAVDFGVKGNYSKSNRTKFETALRNHVSKSTHIYKTKHSGQSGYVIMHLKGNNAAFFKENGAFITAYKLTTTQKNNFIRIGELIIKR